MVQASSIAYVDSEGGTAHVSRHNSVGAAELSSHSGTSTPAYAAAGTRWLDTSATPWVLYMYDGADDIPLGTVNASTNEFIPYAGAEMGESMWARNACLLVQDSTAIFTWDGSNLLWTGHLYARHAGDGSHWATDGYYTIDCPTSGTVTGIGAASNQTATASGIPLAANEALYYIPATNSTNTFVQANLRIVKYGADFTVGPHWIFIAAVDGLSGVILGNGGYLHKWNTPTYQNSWSAASGHSSKGYAKDNNGYTIIDVSITGGTTTNGTTLFTLPAYFRPAESIEWPITSTAADGTRSPMVLIGAAGTVDVYGLSSTPRIAIKGRFKSAA